MSDFINSCRRLINLHGASLNYCSVGTGTYNVATGTANPSKTNFTKTMYVKQIVANNYNFPALIGKETVMFYLVNDSLGFVPKINDEITYKSLVYKIQQITEHVANGSIVLYRLVAARG